jgi:ribonuclease P protein component
MSESFRFSSHERIKKSSEFSVVYSKGTRHFTKTFVVYIKDNAKGHNRIGLSVSKKVGPAHIRNSWKRRLREYFRLNKDTFGASRDIVIVVKKEAGLLEKHMMWQIIQNEFGILCKKITH